MESVYDKVQFYKFSEKEKDKTIRKLKKSLANEKRILLALIFGSLTRRNSVRDIDVGVYSAPTLNPSELLKLNAEIELNLGVPIDLVELTYLSPSFRINILKNGTLIRGKETLLHQLLEQTYSELTSLKHELHGLK